MIDEHVVGEAVRDAIGNADGQSPSGESVIAELAKQGYRLVEVEAERADGRKVHYGSGRQPLDDIIDGGFGGPFCAGNVLKYLRRDKDVEDSKVKAIWYWRKLTEMCQMGGIAGIRAGEAQNWLVSLLKLEELEALGA